MTFKEFRESTLFKQRVILAVSFTVGWGTDKKPCCEYALWDGDCKWHRPMFGEGTQECGYLDIYGPNGKVLDVRQP